MGLQVRLALATTLLLAAATAGSSERQEEISVTDELACGTCRISVERIAMLGDRSGDGILESTSFWASRDEQGRFYVCEGDKTAPVKVFDATGDFLGVIGRRGQGPGEFAQPGIVWIDPEGRIFVYDRTRRLTAFSPSWQHLNSYLLRVSPGNTLVFLPDNRAVLAPGVRRGTEGYPLAVVSLTDGEVLKFFGSVGPLTANTGRVRRVAGPARIAEAVWSGDPRASPQRFELWSTNGELIKAIEKAPGGWHQAEIEREENEFADWGTFGYPVTVALQEDTEGRLWVFTWLIDPKLRENTTVSPSTMFFGSDNGVKDTLIEVIDVHEGTVVARTIIDQQAFPIDLGLLGAATETDDGNIQLEVLRLSLVEAGSW